MKRRGWKSLSFAERCACQDVARERDESPEARALARALAEKRQVRRRQKKRLLNFLAAKRGKKP